MRERARSSTKIVLRQVMRAKLAAERLTLDRVELVRDRVVYFIASLIPLVCALKRTAASVRLRVRPMALTVLYPASVRRVLTSVRVQGRRLSMGALNVVPEREF